MKLTSVTGIGRWTLTYTERCQTSLAGLGVHHVGWMCDPCGAGVHAIVTNMARSCESNRSNLVLPKFDDFD